WDGLPEDYLHTFLANLDRVTTEDVLRVAQRYYRPEKFSLLVCGPEGIYTRKSALRPERMHKLQLEK
ncbi:MAG: hypothetical protein NZL89_05820, partial [Leptospiraceae bacterium]|nr:hypothetical protein [Leptospiraceae bacterium]